MAKPKKNDDKDYVYVRINYSGYIPELKGSGPVKGTFMHVDKLKELIDVGYDIDLVNPQMYPEFAMQFEMYKREQERIRNEKNVAPATSILDENPNNDIDQIAREATLAVQQAQMQKYMHSGDYIDQIAAQVQMSMNNGQNPYSYTPDAEEYNRRVQYVDQLNIIASLSESINNYDGETN